jgi:hypothetical protein
MTNRKLVNLLILSCGEDPYSGKLSKRDSILSAIEIAEIYKTLADEGLIDLALGIESKQWIDIINNLTDKLHNCSQ